MEDFDTANPPPPSSYHNNHNLLKIFFLFAGDTKCIVTTDFEYSTIQNREILQITKMNEDDFGSYTCHAKNELGSKQKAIVLSGSLK